MTPSRRWTPYLFIAPAFLLFAVVVIAPVIGTVYLSFTKWNGYGVPVAAGINNYLRAFRDAVYVQSYWHVLIYIAVTLVVEVLTGLCLAGLVTSRRGTAVYRIAFFVPVMLPMVVIAVLWAFVLNADFGLVNSILRAIGLEQFALVWLGDPRTALLAISLVSGWVYAGFYMAIFYAGFQRIPGEILESAHLDGASEWRIFRTIKVPLVRNVTEVAILLCVTGGIQVFDLVFVMTNGGPYNSTEVPTTYLVRTVFRNQEIGYGSALAVLLTIVVVIVGVAYSWVRRRRDSAVEY